MGVAGILVTTKDCGCTASATQAAIGPMNVLYPNGLCDKGSVFYYRKRQEYSLLDIMKFVPWWEQDSQLEEFCR